MVFGGTGFEFGVEQLSRLQQQLLGFVMIDAASREEALEIASGIPIAEWGSIEVRAAFTASPGLTITSITGTSLKSPISGT